MFMFLRAFGPRPVWAVFPLFVKARFFKLYSMKKFYSFLIFFFLLGAPFTVQGLETPAGFSQQLSAFVQNRPGMQESPAVARLALMRFFVVNNNVQHTQNTQDKQDDAQVRAMASYLVNMYVSAAAYGVDVPAKLSLDYLGVLDAFSRLLNPLDFSKAESFYNKHRTEIQQYLRVYFKQAGLPAYMPEVPSNEARERAFIRLLTQVPVRRTQFYPAYLFPTGHLLPTQVPQEAVDFVAQALKNAQQAGENKVITYEQVSISLEDLDFKFTHSHSNKQCTYRCINDECAYSSYMLGKEMCKAVQEHQAQYHSARVYQITAYAQPCGYVQPAKGDRFTLANGQTAPQWDYHTATLVALKSDGQYTLLVADPFLEGDTPVTLGQWIRRFAPDKTIFTVVPFVRSQTVEDAIKTPEKRQNKNVIINGKTYTPHPVR